MKHQNFRALKDSTYANGMVKNADPQEARRVFRVRDAQAVVGDGADERMDRPGRLRAKGGRVEKRLNRIDDGRIVDCHGGREFASGGAVKDGPAWREGLRSGTPVQNNPSGKNDQQDVNRGRPITYRRGGRV